VIFINHCVYSHLFPVLLESGMNAGPGTSLQILEDMKRASVWCVY
jgi:hypothetical protein